MGAERWLEEGLRKRSLSCSRGEEAAIVLNTVAVPSCPCRGGADSCSEERREGLVIRQTHVPVPGFCTAPGTGTARTPVNNPG
jgi:hypothetical protein